MNKLKYLLFILTLVITTQGNTPIFLDVFAANEPSRNLTTDCGENMYSVDKIVGYDNFQNVACYSETEFKQAYDKMLENAPQIEEVMPKLVKFIGNHIIVAHNANFDVSFLQNNSNKSFSKNKVIDTVALSRKMLPNLPNHKLNTVARYIGIQEDGFHRAEFDCECCAKIYIKYLENM